MEQEATIPTTRYDEEVKRGLEIGLPGASSIEDKDIPTFSRGELPHFAGINTFMKAPFVEDVRNVGGVFIDFMRNFFFAFHNHCGFMLPYFF